MSSEAQQINRRRRGVLGGLVLVAIGATLLLPPLGVSNAFSYLLLALGTAFGVAYVQGMRPTVYLVPAATLFGLGIGLLLPTWLQLPGELRGATFLAALAIAFGAISLARRGRRWPLVPGALLGAVALAELYGRGEVIPAAVQPFLVPAILVLVGTYILVVPRLD